MSTIKEVFASIVTFFGGVSRLDLAEAGVDLKKLAREAQSESERLATQAATRKQSALEGMESAHEAYRQALDDAEAELSSATGHERKQLAKARSENSRSSHLGRLAKRLG